MRAIDCGNFGELCRQYGISRKTGYKWRDRFVSRGMEGMVEESRRPHRHSEALGEEVVCRIVRLRSAHPHWGARKIRELYLPARYDSLAALDSREQASDGNHSTLPSGSFFIAPARLRGIARGDLAFSRSLGWGPQKRERLAEIERQVVVIDISDRRVMEAFADLSTLAQKSAWSLFHGKHDIWVAAAAKAAGAHLLSMDKDFLPLRGLEGWSVTILDAHTGEPITAL